MSTEDPGAPTDYAKHPLGALFASTRDETDDDHTGRVRTTPAGSIWEVASIDRYDYANGSVCAYTLVCPATGAAITPYTPIEGVPYGHPRDEMADFLPIELPGQTWPTLRLQLKALCEVKDAVVETWGENANPEVDTDTITNELRKAGILPSDQP